MRSLGGGGCPTLHLDPGADFWFLPSTQTPLLPQFQV